MPTLYDRHGEAYMICNKHHEEDCEVCAGLVHDHCIACGDSFEDVKPHWTERYCVGCGEKICDYCGEYHGGTEDIDGEKICPECRAKQERKVRLDQLTKQIQDAFQGLNELFPVINIRIDKDQGMAVLMRDERDVADNFPSYFRVPMEDSTNYNSEVYATLNKTRFHTYSKLPVPAGCSKVVVANPEREAV